MECGNRGLGRRAQPHLDRRPREYNERMGPPVRRGGAGRLGGGVGRHRPARRGDRRRTRPQSRQQGGFRRPRWHTGAGNDLCGAGHLEEAALRARPAPNLRPASCRAWKKPAIASSPASPTNILAGSLPSRPTRWSSSTAPCRPIRVFQSLRGASANDGFTDIDALLAGRPQSAAGKPGFMLHRIGDCQSSRNIHSAVYDALRLALTL